MRTTPDPVTMTMMSATDALQACTAARAEGQQEIARFVDQRLADNRRSWEALMTARDIAGVIKVQQEWGLRATTDYTQEAVRLTRLLTIFRDGTTPAVQDATRLVA